MVPRASRILLALAAAGSGAEAFKFLSNFKAPKIISESQKVKLAKTEERFGDKKLVVVTGCSSDIGRETVKNLLASGDYHVVGAVRDAGERAAVADGLDGDRLHLMDCELDSFDSVRRFCADLEEYRLAKPIDRLICNAGAYQADAPASAAAWSADGHERTMQISFLSHFLMVSELLDGMRDAPDPRVIAVCSVAGDDRSADLKGLDGFRAGFARPVAMADGYGFDGAKAHADSKLALAATSRLLHAKFHKSHGVAFSSVRPGRVSETEERAWLRERFPAIMERVAGGLVGEEEAGRRLFQAAHDPKCGRSGVEWEWDGEDSVNVSDPSEQVDDLELGVALFQTATEITGAEWPSAKTFRSPCPTLHVIGAVSKNMMMREELKRMAERPGFNEDGTQVKLSKRKRAALIADRVIVQGVLGNTVGRVGKLAGRLVLGRIPETAKTGSFQEEKLLEDAAPVPAAAAAEDASPALVTDIAPAKEESTKYIDITDAGDASLIHDLEEEIFEQVFANGKDAGDASGEREWKVGEPEKLKELSMV